MSLYFPINLALEGRQCVVVGGGTVALRKVRSLLACGAHVTVVSLDFCPELAALDGVHLVQARFDPVHVAGAILVFAATSDQEVNRQVARASRANGAIVNVVDVPAECDFIVPSTLTRGELTISVCSGGAAPALSKRLRRRLEAQFPDAFADYVALLAELRAEIMPQVADPAHRSDIYHQLADEPTWTLFQTEGADAVRWLACRLIAESG